MSNQLKNINITRFIIKEIGKFNKGAIEHRFNVPWRNDRKASGSFNSEKNVWYDHGTDERGDVIDFIARKYGLSRVEARKRAKRKYGRKIKIKNLQGKIINNVNNASNNSDPWVVMNPVPIEAEDSPIPQGVYPHLSKTHEAYYRDKYGNLKGYVGRWEDKDGNKTVRPFAFCRNVKTGEKAWRMKGFPKPYPLLGIHKLHHTTGPIMLVEGEKCYDAACSIMREVLLVLTWHGGAKRVKDTDWSPLHGINREIVFFPDNDTAGVNAMVEVMRAIENAKL